VGGRIHHTKFTKKRESLICDQVRERSERDLRAGAERPAGENPKVLNAGEEILFLRG